VVRLSAGGSHGGGLAAAGTEHEERKFCRPARVRRIMFSSSIVVERADTIDGSTKCGGPVASTATA